MGRSQRHKIEEQGFASNGSFYDQGAVNDKILGAIGGSVANARPVLTSISPTTAVKGGADLTLTATGSGFTTGNTKILFNGGVETTTFVSATSLTTVVKPSLVSVAPITVPVQVIKGASLVSADTKQFTFTATLRGAAAVEEVVPAVQEPEEDDDEYEPVKKTRRKK